MNKQKNTQPASEAVVPADVQPSGVQIAKKDHHIYRAHDGRLDDIRIVKGEPVVVPKEYLPGLKVEGVI